MTLRDLSQLAKPRLSAVVLLSAVAGYFLALDHNTDGIVLLHMLLGTALVSTGASALNQVLERNVDFNMLRTQDRPLPSRRLEAPAVLVFGIASALIGMVYLANFVNLQAACWATLTLTLYVFVYTPLKRVTILNTLVGAIPGAMPPLIGWAAARGDLDFRAWTLFAILFVWQLPHFLAIAWLYREDYARAGLKMLPGIDPEGLRTGRQMLLHSITLLPISLVPVLLDMTEKIYAPGAIVLGVVFMGFCLNFSIRRNDAAARGVFLSSIVYLTLLLSLLIYDKR